MKPKVELYTDGSCLGNPGPGGWGAVLRYNDIERNVSGAEANTTNNRMELLAAIEGLATLKRACSVDLTTDSKYVKDGITKWIHNWKKNNWKTANGKPVKNEELWRLLDRLSERHDIEWHWVKGHSGHKYNEIADELARGAISQLEHMRHDDTPHDKPTEDDK